ncbi:MAG: hypothetical protein C0504_06205 [Candidatus Solibacter sp.]|nr:hypothetical protein [Candidatus Solibacter sp.]
MDQNQIKFGIELPKELHRQVKIAVAMHGLKMKEASEQAFTAWLKAHTEGGVADAGVEAQAKQAVSPFGNLSGEEEQFVAWVLAMLRQKKPSSASEIALQAVRMAGAELLGEAPVAARKKQKAG